MNQKDGFPLLQITVPATYSLRNNYTISLKVNPKDFFATIILISNSLELSNPVSINFVAGNICDGLRMATFKRYGKVNDQLINLNFTIPHLPD